MAAMLTVAAALPVWRPALPLVWAPLAVVLGAAASTLVHEGAHAWAAHALGYQVDWVVVGGLVGVTAYRGRDDRPLERAAVALRRAGRQRRTGAGAARGQAVVDLIGLASVLAEAAIGLNALALAANLVPVGGTDGALLVRAVVEHRCAGRRRPDGARGGRRGAAQLTGQCGGGRLAAHPRPDRTLADDVPRRRPAGLPGAGPGSGHGGRQPHGARAPPESPKEGELARAPLSRSVVMIVIGSVAAIWALASLLAG